MSKELEHQARVFRADGQDFLPSSTSDEIISI